ncbi:MAG: choice-of-anchor D domain-containing protein, partial [Verrucomicrobia bacterium]|nr:choice-of-anchor D domain-containing protein [Verrucomicrobiota bacterium]
MKKYWLKPLAFLALFSVFTHATVAASGDVDTGFSPDPNGRSVYGVAVQPDGKIVLGGYFTTVSGTPRNYAARLNADGTLDSGFNPNANNGVNCVAVQTDGKILLGGPFTTMGGQTRNNVARVDASAALDANFNPNANGAIHGMALQADGKILIGGQFTTVGGVARDRIARLNADGSLDTLFDSGATGPLNVDSIAIQADGKIVIGGSFTAVGGQTRNRIARLNADGTLDTGFNPNADAAVPCVAVQADGKILIGGTFTSLGGVARNHVARLNADGTLDASFNPNANSNIDTIAVQADGKIVIGGSFTAVGGTTRNRLARLNADGTLDTGFNPNANDLVNSVAGQADGKIVVGGAFTTVGGAARNRIARLENDAASQGLTVPNSSSVQWLRGDSSPETLRVTFDLSTDGGTTWSPLGTGTRITGGWALTGLSLPAGGQIRARARTIGGNFNGSSGLVETAAAFSTCIPQILVRGKSVTILDGDTTPTGNDDTDFFDVPVCGGSKTHTFTIYNFGKCPLIVTNIASSNPSEFTVGPLTFSIVIAAGGAWHDFTVTFDPNGPGTRTATLSIASDDITANPYDFALSGNGIATPSQLVLTCATNKTVTCGAAWTFDPPTATDAGSAANVPITILNTVTNGNCPTVITRTWQAVDACGNTNTCSQTVTVTDTTPPVFTCPTNKVVQCGTAWTFDTPTATDNCSPASAAGPALLPIAILSTVTNGLCPLVITRTWQAVDACNNTNTCSQTVTVLDTTPVTLSVSGSANIFGAGHTSPPNPAGGGTGILPPSHSFPAGPGKVLRFSSVTGTASLTVSLAFSGPDGYLGNLPTDINSFGGISGIKHDGAFFLVGVFLEPGAPSGTAPARLDFRASALGTNF